MLNTDTQAPDFELPDSHGNMVKLSDFRGKKVVLYFYSKDNTSGCTRQAQGYAELYDSFAEKNAVVIGISKDTSSSHEKFAEKYSLPFILLSDTEKKVIELYDVWKEKKLYGKTSMGVVRTTYLINESGM
ncbi:MAG: peroxiredoxin, partial [Oscillospiraceae bacterium]|nr:peroxiredoxin [Oscillospiraceae bacterium]